MAPPKPSQRGKFRPKKPIKAKSSTDAKKIGSDIPQAIASDPNLAIARSNRYSGTDGGRGRGRGGRGRGRGRGRIPTPQGNVFFTGGEKSASTKASSKKSAVGSNRNKGGSKILDGDKNKRNVDTSTEEVVGQLDTAIGSTNKSEKGKILDKELTDYNENEEGVVVDNAGSSMANICMYDSDSSDEKVTIQSRENSHLIAPLELPFSEVISSRSNNGTKYLDKPDLIVSSSNGIHHSESEKAMPPFVNITSPGEDTAEKKSWFLVQLPTRLPPMEKNDDIAVSGGAIEQTEENDTIKEKTSTSDNNMMNNLSSVAVPPVTTSNFDNGLATIAPGRIGKIVVFKSGKTILVIDSQDSKQVNMEVNEGLTCAFHQEAVALTAEGAYISLGDVTKSIVISPDLTDIISG